MHHEHVAACRARMWRTQGTVNYARRQWNAGLQDADAAAHEAAREKERNAWPAPVPPVPHGDC